MLVNVKFRLGGDTINVQATEGETNCYAASFRGANLSGANFSEASLFGADFNGANLDGAMGV